MTTKYVSADNLAYYDALIKNHYAPKSEVPSKLSQLDNDYNYVRDASYVHTDSNYTSDEKTKLAGVATGAQVNVIEAVTVNNVAVTPSAKSVNISVPTDNKSLSNGAGYQTSADVNSIVTAKGYQTSAEVKSAVEAYGYQTAAQVNSAITSKNYQTAANVKSTVEGYGYQTAAQVSAAINEVVGGITSISYLPVDELPETGSIGVIYLIQNGDSGDNAYDEYIWTGSAFERLGSQDLDLSGYIKSADLAAMTNAEVDKLFE